MNTITIKDATGNIICSVESSPITVTTSPIDDSIKNLSKCSTESFDQVFKFEKKYKSIQVYD